MKKLFALMLALMLALGCVSAVSAEDAAAPAAGASSGTIHLKINLNADAVAAMTGAADEAAAKQASMIISLVNDLGITMTSDGKDAEMFITSGDQALAGLGVIKNEDKMLLVSDLFPKYALAVDQKAMAGMASGIPTNAAGGFTMPQISMSDEQMAALTAPFAKVGEQITAKVGEPETVEETMYGAVFTVKNPINLSTKELLDIVLPAVKEVVSQESFTSLLDQLKAQGMNVNFDKDEIDKKIEELQNKKEDELPVMDASIYSNEADDNLFILHLDKTEESFAFHSGTVAGKTVVEMNVGTKFYLMLESGSEATTLKIQVAPQEGTLVDIDGDIRTAAEGFSATFNVKVNDLELGSVVIDGAPNGVLSGNFTAEGKTEIAVTDLQNGNSEAAQGFMSDFQMGLMTALFNASKTVPSIQDLLQQMMPKTETQP